MKRFGSALILAAALTSTLCSCTHTKETAFAKGGDVFPSPQTAWLELSTPDWRVWVVQSVADARPSYPILHTSYFRQPASGGKATRVHHVTRGWYPRVLAVLSDGTIVLDGDGGVDLRWIPPEDQKGGKLVQHDGLGKEWRVVAGYVDGLLIAPFRTGGSEPPDTFIPIRNGRLMQTEKIALPFHTQLNPRWLACRIVRHKNTLAWIERPNRKGDPQSRKSSRLVTFSLDTAKRAEVTLRTVTNHALFKYDGETAVTTGGYFFDATSGKNLILNAETPGISGDDELRLYNELHKAVSPPAGKSSALAVRDRTLYYVSVVRRNEHPTEYRIMAMFLGRPLSKPSCLLKFPYYKCSPPHNEAGRPDLLLSRQCIVTDDGISVWNGTKWVSVPWVTHSDNAPAQPDTPADADKPRR